MIWLTSQCFLVSKADPQHHESTPKGTHKILARIGAGSVCMGGISGSSLRQSRPAHSTSHLHFTSGCFILWYLSEIIPGAHVAEAIELCTYLLTSKVISKTHNIITSLQLCNSRSRSDFRSTVFVYSNRPSIGRFPWRWLPIHSLCLVPRPSSRAGAKISCDRAGRCVCTSACLVLLNQIELSGDWDSHAV